MSDSASDRAAVTDNQQESRFELASGGHLAVLTYRRRAARLVLMHTGVPAELEGRGIGGQLVRAAAGRAAAEGLTLVPVCEFAREWLRRHPDVAGTVTLDWAS